MSIELNLLRCLTQASDFKKLAPVIPRDALDPAVVNIINNITEWYSKFNASYFDVDMFLTWSDTIKNKTLSEDEKLKYRHFVKRMSDPVSEEIRAGMLAELHELRFMTSLGTLVQKWADGDAPEASNLVQQLHTRFKTDLGIQSDPWIKEDINTLLDDMADNSGIKWRLECLNNSMRGLRPGDTGIIAARPDRGKTTFFASEVTFMAQQLPPDKRVIWLNNEGVGARIIPRLYQAALGCTMSELVKLRDAGELQTKYILSLIHI